MHDSSYRDVLVETVHAPEGGHRLSIRVRPVAGQGLPPDMKVECANGLRKAFPVGTRFLLRAKVTDREGGTPFLYSYFGWAPRPVDKAQAQAFLANRAR